VIIWVSLVADFLPLFRMLLEILLMIICLFLILILSRRCL